MLYIIIFLGLILICLYHLYNLCKTLKRPFVLDEKIYFNSRNYGWVQGKIIQLDEYIIKIEYTNSYDGNVEVETTSINCPKCSTYK